MIDETNFRLAAISRSRVVLNGVRALFWLVALATVLAAEMPESRAPHLLPWDKAEHFVAFYVLTTLATAAYPRVSLVMLALGLSLFGAVIELAQALPFIHRDCDIWDWVADAIAVGAALLPMFLDRWRRRNLAMRA